MKERNIKTIVLKPAMRQLFVETWSMFILLIVAVLAAGIDLHITKLCGVIGVLIAMTAILRKLAYLNSVSWTISDSKIKYKHGVLHRKTDFTELYRIVDFEESQNLLQQIFGIKTIIIISSDRTHQIMYMDGISHKSNIVEILEQRVKLSRKENGIYEIANR
jgi:uncharacterized membrane protein YdbT with pleckstrin-like domain